MLAVKVMTYVVDNPERNTGRNKNSVQPIQIPAELLWAKERSAGRVSSPFFHSSATPDEHHKNDAASQE